MDVGEKQRTGVSCKAVKVQGTAHATIDVRQLSGPSLVVH